VASYRRSSSVRWDGRRFFHSCNINCRRRFFRENVKGYFGNSKNYWMHQQSCRVPLAISLFWEAFDFSKLCLMSNWASLILRFSAYSCAADGQCNFTSTSNTRSTCLPTFNIWRYQFKARQCEQSPPNGMILIIMDFGVLITSFWSSTSSMCCEIK